MYNFKTEEDIIAKRIINLVCNEIIVLLNNNREDISVNRGEGVYFIVGTNTKGGDHNAKFDVD